MCKRERRTIDFISMCILRNFFQTEAKANIISKFVYEEVEGMGYEHIKYTNIIRLPFTFVFHTCRHFVIQHCKSRSFFPSFFSLHA